MSAERDLISVLLNRPGNKFIIDVNPDWFADVNLRWTFEAISGLDNDHVNTLNVFGRIKQKHPKTSLQLTDLNSIAGQFVTDAGVDQLAINLHRSYLSRTLHEQMAQYQRIDTDDYLQAVRETMGLLDRLQVVSDDGSLGGAFDELADGMEHNRPVGIRSLPKFDKMLGGGLYGGMLLTIGARPGIGKTAYCLNLAYEIVHNDPEVEVDYFTLEMPKREIANRLVSVDTGISTEELKKPYYLSPTKKMAVKASMNTYRKYCIRVFDKVPNLATVLSTIRRNASKKPRNKYVAMVDYIGLIKVPGDLQPYAKIGEVTRELKIIANECNIPIVELSQLNRGIENRVDKRPMLSDLRESGSVEQDSNVVGFLYKPDEKQAPQIERLVIAKNRDGVTGDIPLYFNGAGMKFQEINEDV